MNVLLVSYPQTLIFVWVYPQKGVSLQQHPHMSKKGFNSPICEIKPICIHIYVYMYFFKYAALRCSHLTPEVYSIICISDCVRKCMYEFECVCECDCVCEQRDKAWLQRLQLKWHIWHTLCCTKHHIWHTLCCTLCCRNVVEYREAPLWSAHGPCERASPCC